MTTTHAELVEGILTVTLARPEKLNAFNAAMCGELIEHLDRADADDAVRAVIVTGEGRAFCAGADLTDDAAIFDYGGGSDFKTADSPVRADGTVDFDHPGAQDAGGRLTLRIFRSVKPVIGAINGPAIGIGATMLLPMDIRIASETARFGFTFTRLGIVPEGASTWFLPRLVGISRALEWGLGGRVVPADEALAAGLVRDVVPAGALLSTARAIAAAMVTGTSPVSVALTRRMMWSMLAAEHPIEASRLDTRLMWHRGAASDVGEGVAALKARRMPDFPDRVSDGLPDGGPWLAERSYRREG